MNEFPGIKTSHFWPFKSITTTPHLQPWKLSYIKSAVLTWPMSHMQPTQCDSILSNISKNAPWLADALQELAIMFPELENRHEVVFASSWNDKDRWASFFD
jgi:hypothetical protein